MYHEPLTLNCRGRLLSLERPVLMGILNVTPDSFSDGGQFMDCDLAVKHATRMLDEGAAIIDVGGMSSRPGAQIISPEEEKRRVLPVIEAIRSAHPEAILSIDTVHATVAQAAVEAGASIINDISAASIDPGIIEVAAQYRTPYVLMHMKGTPEDMQQRTQYDNVSLEVLDFLIDHITRLREKNLTDIIVDPGFGFGKTLDQNYQLLNHLHTFKMLEAPLMVGISRKSMIYKLLNINPKESVNATTALHIIALQQGAKILRAHDVREAKEAIDIFMQVTATKSGTCI